jgi:hypothetical protein
MIFSTSRNLDTVRKGIPLTVYLIYLILVVLKMKTLKHVLRKLI